MNCHFHVYANGKTHIVAASPELIDKCNINYVAYINKTKLNEIPVESSDIRPVTD